MSRDHTIGFTGTSKGMTEVQIETVSNLLSEYWELGYYIARHGVCVGADAQFHSICLEKGYLVIGHPGVGSDGKQVGRAQLSLLVTRIEKPFLVRNHDIVDESSLMIAVPKSISEEQRSGTWATIRYAQKKLKPLTIVWPYGSYDVFNGAVRW